jgi:2-keto-4-pentenoate hydratase/2-oxohepta-3-ene-1,7-dioic acid hydratase in catechol pathway
MKLLRYGLPGQEQPGLLDGQGSIRSLAGVVPDIALEVLSPAGLARLAALEPDSLPVVEGSPRLGPPVGQVRQFMALGLNYALHAREANVPVPAQPSVFSKAISCIAGPNDDIPLYPGSVRLDYEVELAVVIGTRAHRVSEDQALRHVAGYCIGNDVSEREWQIERGGTIIKGKSAPGYGPLGPWLVTADEVPDPQQLHLRTWVNGELRQDSSTSDMVVGVARFIAHLSEFMMLLPGDVLITGTPAGVALGMKPPAWLKPGDEVRMAIDGLGELRQRVVVA